MDKTKHPVDDLFSKGIEDFQMEPSPEIKKKVFASSAAIKPVKPWFIGLNWMLITTSVIATASFIFYFGFYNNGQSNKVSVLNKNITSNTTLQNVNKLTLSSVSDKNIVADGSTLLNINSNELPAENNDEVDNKKSNVVIEENAVYKQIINNSKTQNTVKLSSNISQVKTDNLQKSNIVNTNKKNVTKQEDNVENNTTVTVLADLNNSEKSIHENLETNYSNSALSSNPNIITNLSSSVNLNTVIDKSAILFFMERKAILLSSQQIAECMKILSEKPAHYNKSLWFVEAKVGVVLSKYNVSAKNSEWKPSAEAKKQLLNSSLGSDIQISGVYQNNKFIFKGGLNYVNYGEKLSGNLLVTNPHNSEQIYFVNNHYDAMLNGNYYNYDTLGSYYHYTYVQTDHIIKVDSVLAWHVQKVLVDMYDTTNVTIFDTLPKTTINNSIKYFEIPLTFGYVIPMGRFNLTLSANISPGYFTSVRGSQMNAINYPALEPYQKSTFKKFTLNAEVSFELGYMLNESITLIAEPYYKRSLLPLYSDKNNINQTNNNFGFRIGIRKLL